MWRGVLWVQVCGVLCNECCCCEGVEVLVYTVLLRLGRTMRQVSARLIGYIVLWFNNTYTFTA